MQKKRKTTHVNSSCDSSRIVACSLSKLYFSSAAWCPRPPIDEEKSAISPGPSSTGSEQATEWTWRSALPHAYHRPDIRKHETGGTVGWKETYWLRTSPSRRRKTAFSGTTSKDRGRSSSCIGP